MSTDDQSQRNSLVLSKDLVSETRAVVQERQKVESLLNTAESGRDKVKQEIYEKVTADYRVQLDAIAGRYAPLRDRMVEELSTIRAHELELRSQLGQIRDQLDELRFRCNVGEFDKSELEKRETEKKGTIEALEANLATAEKTYGVARELLGEEVEAVLSGKPPSPASAAASAPAPALIDEPEPAPEESAPPPPPEKPEKPEKPEGPPAPAAPPAADPPPSQRTVEIPADSPPPVTALTDTRTLTQGLLTRKKPDGGKTFVIDADGLVLGRSTSCDVLIQGATVSRRHAVISWEDDAYWIEDVSSGGGLSVNGEREQRVKLKSGDQVEIGAALFEYEGP
ncbi:MAG TPA: FHA domain-containing protein [Thermoanaerobaculia bacterium]|nr:FHA domain-containing protein [Thermoanaerobaculia bacterium]